MSENEHSCACVNMVSAFGWGVIMGCSYWGIKFLYHLFINSDLWNM